MTDEIKPLTPAVVYLLLGLADGPRHGYSLMKQVEASGGPVMGPGTVYGTLSRLQEAGLVREVGSIEVEGRLRRQYALTDAGRNTLRREGRRLVALTDALAERGLVPGGGNA